MMSRLTVFIFFMLCFLFVNKAKAQSETEINWISFNQLNEALHMEPKKVFVEFYADWCIYCKEMQRTTFKDTDIIKALNENYYAVRMNVESDEQITFGNQVFINKRIKKINPVHELALLLAGRKDAPFSLPAYLLFDEQFKAKARYFQFLDKNALMNILR